MPNLRKRSDVRYRQIDGEAVVLRQDAGETLVLNEAGSLILDSLARGRPVEEIADALAAEFEVDAQQAFSDVLVFAAELEAAGILEKTVSLEEERPCR